ncbi:MAG TPA: hypothetical protein DC024_10450 [Clostridiales bacterium]|nr:hypothetical protein [Clostridiales bacterium]
MTDKQLVDLMHLLTVEDHQAVEHIIKRLVILNDPNYTRLTPMEKKELNEAVKDNGNLITHEKLKKEIGI